MMDRRFCLAPGVELVALNEGQYTLRSEFDAVQLSGDEAIRFAEQVLRALDEPRLLKEIESRMPGFSPSSILRQLETLVSNGLLVEVPGEGELLHQPFTALLQSIGSDAADTQAKLAKARVSIYGLEAHGAHLALILARMGVGRFRLVDPFPFEAAHLTLTPVTDSTAIGQPRQTAVARLLRDAGAEIELVGQDTLDTEAVRSVLVGSDLALGCWDSSFAAAQHWLNRAALETGVPVLFGELRATTFMAGPLYLPRRSSCWMCYRMRAVACAKDFDQAIAFEEHLDHIREPRLHARPILPVLPEMLASTMAMEVLRILTGLHPPVLVDRVMEYDAFSGRHSLHPVLTVPHCVVCAKKKARRHLSLVELIADPPQPADPAQLVDTLVSPRTGIVSQFGAVSRDTSETPLPLVWRAQLSNHRFFSERDEDRATCSGKGMTLLQAWRSCLGEAIERYSGSCWSDDELHLARHDELDGRALDPRDLVLYNADQYESLQYTPYTDDAELNWVRAHSLVSGNEIWVPAIAILMDYPVRDLQEYLFPITSNGLASGPTAHEAVLNALNEVLERDAMLVSWLNQLPGRPHAAADHPDEDVRTLNTLYARRGVELALVQLPSDTPVSVFMGIAFQREGSGPYATVGLGAHIQPSIAARQAALEVGQVRPSLRRRARLLNPERIEELAASPQLVASLEDHALLYTHHSTANAFTFLFGERATWQTGPEMDSAETLAHLIEHFRARDQDVLYFDLTPPDMRALGVYTARVVLPGYQPIWFGREERRLGGQRIFEFALNQGFREQAVTLDEFNPMPHPIA